MAANGGIEWLDASSVSSVLGLEAVRQPLAQAGGETYAQGLAAARELRAAAEGAARLAEVAAKIVSDWKRTETLQFEPFAFPGEEGLGLAVRLAGAEAARRMQEQAAAGAFGESDIRTVEAQGAHFLDLRRGHIATPGAPTHLTWHDFIAGRYKDWAVGSGQNPFTALAAALRAALGEHIGCIQVMIEYQQPPPGALYVKEHTPQLYLSPSGAVNDQFATVAPGGVVFTVGLKAVVEENGRRFPKEFVKFSCVHADKGAVVIPPNPKDRSVLPPADWSALTGDPEDQHAGCLHELFAKAHFAERFTASPAVAVQ